MDIERTFDELHPGLFRYCHLLTGDADLADDVAQEAFVRLCKHGVEGDERGLRAWLFRTATHLVRDRYRVEKNRRRLLEANPVRPAALEAPDRQIERNEAVRRVRAALDRLGERDRAMLLARHEGLSYRELATAFRVAPGSVGTLLARAQKRFVRAYEPDGENG